MTQQATVRRASQEDFATLLSMHRALHIEHRDSHLCSTVKEASGYENFDSVLESDLRSLLRDRTTFVFIAERNGRTAGYVSGKVRHEPGRLLPKRGFMEDWWVDPEHRGRGVGRRLFEALRAAFESAGCQVFESSTWSSNESARTTHQKLGFIEAQVSYRLLLKK